MDTADVSKFDDFLYRKWGIEKPKNAPNLGEHKEEFL